MTAIHKNKPERDKKYLRAICENGCCICGQSAIPHHLKGYKQGNIKVSDYLTIPLCDRHHSATYETGLHKDIEKWEEMHGLQTNLIRHTLAEQMMNNNITWELFNKYSEICTELNYRFR